MSRLGMHSYIERSLGGRDSNPKNWRDWWMIKDSGLGYGCIFISSITFPKKYVGKKVRLKVEEVKQ